MTAIIRRFGSVFACLLLVCCVSGLPVCAEGEEETTETPTETAPSSDTVAVSDAMLAAKLDTLQETLDRIVAAVTPAEGETSEVSAAPDYSDQLAALSADVAEIKETVQATPETAKPDNIWDKPFDTYTPTEGLLLIMFVLLAVLCLILFLR